MHDFARTLFPLCRSITGEGLRATLRAVGAILPLEIHEVATGTPVLDWTIPDEWNIRDGYIAKRSGERVVDFRESNLHVVGYSEPVRELMRLEDLRQRLHVHLEQPDWVPYRTSYYARTWGFCLSQRQLDGLEDETYEVVVDSTLAPGSLSYGECLLKGETDEEVLLTTHVCHPSLANDNLSGITVLTEIGAALLERPHRLSYRLLFVPGTIGSIAWLSANEDTLPRVSGGLVLACLGDSAPLTYKRSRRGDAVVDRAGACVVERGRDGRLLDFAPWGWDERQFNTPGFDLPVGCLTRSLEGEFTEYHSSADDLDLIGAEHLEESLDTALEILHVLERDRTYRNLSPKGEPQLGRRGLYRAVGGADPETGQLALLWVLNQSDGSHSLLEIAERSGLAFATIEEAATRLEAAGLLADAS
jgi:aminopeptidase-like protein